MSLNSAPSVFGDSEKIELKEIGSNGADVFLSRHNISEKGLEIGKPLVENFTGLSETASNRALRANETSSGTYLKRKMQACWELQNHLFDSETYSNKVVASTICLARVTKFGILAAQRASVARKKAGTTTGCQLSVTGNSAETSLIAQINPNETGDDLALS